jgi:hypothetical protein
VSPTEAAQLLSILSAIDRREFDAPTAKAWAHVFRDTPYERVEQAAFRAIDAGVYVDVAAIKKQLGAMRASFERDVRSAKARGLVNADWPTSTPLPKRIEQRLRDAQAKDWANSNDNPDELTAGPAAPAVARAIA